MGRWAKPRAISSLTSVTPMPRAASAQADPPERLVDTAPGEAHPSQQVQRDGVRSPVNTTLCWASGWLRGIPQTVGASIKVVVPRPLR